MTPHQMLDALSRQTGAALAFNGDGLCRLRFDGRFIVDLEVTDDEDAIYLYARLGTLPAGEQGRELMARMMRAHCLGRESGNTLFGLDGECPQVGRLVDAEHEVKLRLTLNLTQQRVDGHVFHVEIDSLLLRPRLRTQAEGEHEHK